MSEHSLNGPSSFKRRKLCPGSANAERDLPETSSEYAREGTAAHLVLEQCLEYGLDALDLIGDEIEVDGQTFTVTEEMAGHLQPVIDRIREIEPWPIPERRVDLSLWLENTFGTCDVTILRPDQLIIIDLKYGQGLRVDAEENEQLMLYALGALGESVYQRPLDFPVRLVIEQPRLNHTDVWDTDVRRLLSFAEEASAIDQATKDPDAPRHASEEACQFCKAASDCPTLAQKNLELFALKFDDLDADVNTPPTLPDPEGLTPERRSYVLSHAKLLRKWLDALEEAAIADFMAGKPVPHLKVVEGRGSRVWSDEAEAERFLREHFKLSDDDIFNKKMTSPAQAEKLVGAGGKADLQSLIAKKEGRPTLVSENDKRPALRQHVNKFSDLDADELV